MLGVSASLKRWGAGKRARRATPSFRIPRSNIGNVVNFNWTYDEVVLAAALVAQNEWRGLTTSDTRVTQLSELLREATIHSATGRLDSFRSPSSVARKSFDIATRHPDYQGKRTHGGRYDAAVLKEFIDEPTRMNELAVAIRSEIIAGKSAPPASDPDLESLTAFEGAVVAAAHLRRERNPKLREAKIASVRHQGRAVQCEVCGFDFATRYGLLGEGYIEVHHVLPLHASGLVVTRLKDLALLCSNCHRMIHRAHPWVTPDELREMLEAKPCPRPFDLHPSAVSGKLLERISDFRSSKDPADEDS